MLETTQKASEQTQYRTYQSRISMFLYLGVYSTYPPLFMIYYLFFREKVGVGFEGDFMFLLL